MLPPVAQVQGVEVEVFNTTSVRVLWSPVSLPEATGYIILYGLRCDCNSLQDLSVRGGKTSSTVVTVGGSELQLEYQFQVQAVVEVEGEVFLGERSGISSVPPITEKKRW